MQRINLSIVSRIISAAVLLLTAAETDLWGEESLLNSILTRRREIHRELTEQVQPGIMPEEISQEHSEKRREEIEEGESIQLIEEKEKPVNEAESSRDPPEQAIPFPEQYDWEKPVTQEDSGERKGQTEKQSAEVQESPTQSTREVPEEQPQREQPQPQPQPEIVEKPEEPEIDTFNTKTSELEKDQVYAVLGDSVTVSLKGEGWMYLGEKDHKEGITFLSRESFPGNTDFLFEVARKGVYELAFQYQESSTAETFIKRVGIEVVSKEEFSRYVGTEQEDTFYKPGDMDEADYSVAERLYENGRYAEALEEYKTRYVPGNPEIADRIASLSLQCEKYTDALRFWEQNLDAEEIYNEKAVAGIIEAAIALEDYTLFHSYIADFIAAKQIPIERQLLDAALFAEKKEYNNTAVSLLETLIERYPDSSSLDLVYYTLGRIYEKKSSIQDVKEAINYYTIVCDEFPASEYWITAEERKKYLNRHYLHIR